MTAGAVDVAVFQLLRGDALLTTLVPGGIYRDVAPEAVVAVDDALQCFGTVSTVTAVALPTFCDPVAFEQIAYDVQFSAPSSNPADVQAAFDRTEQLLAGLLGATAGRFQIACSRPSARQPNAIPDPPVRWETRLLRWEVWASATAPEPEPVLLLSSPLFAAQNTPTTNDLSDAGYTFAAASPLLMDPHGTLIIWAERHLSGNARLRPVVSNDGGATWTDPAIIGFSDSGGEAQLTRCACAYDAIHDQLHGLFQAVDAATGIMYRRYTIVRDGRHHITAITRDADVNLQLDLATGPQRFLLYPSLLWQPIGPHGQILAVWSIQNDVKSAGAELRASMRVLSHTPADGVAANWRPPVVAALDGIGNPPRVPYSLLAARKGMGGPPEFGLLLKAAGSHIGDVYLGGWDGRLTVQGGAWKVLRMIWNAAAGDWSNGLAPVVTLDTVTVAGNDTGYPLKQELVSQLTEDRLHDRVYMAYPVWLDNTAGDTQCLRYLDAADRASPRVVIASAGGPHRVAPTVDCVCDPTTGAAAVVYQKTDQGLYAQVFDGLTQVQADTVVFPSAPVDSPLLWPGGRTAADHLLVAFRDHVGGTPPYLGYFGTMVWGPAS